MQLLRAEKIKYVQIISKTIRGKKIFYLQIEDLDVKSLMKRKRETRINPKTGRPFSKKRYGKAVFKAAPGYFRSALIQVLSQLDVRLILYHRKRQNQVNITT